MGPGARHLDRDRGPAGRGHDIGTEAASRAAPDGNTVAIIANSFIIHPNFKKLNYDPLTSFEPVCQLANSPQVIVVNHRRRTRR